MVNMRVWLGAGLLSWGLLSMSSLQAEYRPPIFDFEIGVGYRHDNYKMDMAGFVLPSSNFLGSSQEIWRWKWNEVEIVESSATLRYTSCLNYYVRMYADWGRIHNGEGHLDGFANEPGTGSISGSSISDEKYLHFSRIKNKTNRGSVMDFSGAVGYQFRSNGRRCILTPLLGFSYHHQKLEFHHGKQVIDLFDPFPVLGDIPDLHVMYKPRWYGPFIGIDWEVQVDVPCVLIYGSAEYHWTQYRTTASWNFSDTFINNFNQNSNGHGLIINGGISQKLQCDIWITAFATYRNFQAKRGKHKTVSSKNKLLFPTQTFGTFPVFNPDRSNKMIKFKWNSWVAGLAFDYRF